MRLKSYQAATMKEALALVREELGEDAIILSSARGDGGFGVKVTAAIDTPEPAVVPPPHLDDNDLESPANRPEIVQLLAEVLTSHGVEESLIQRLLRTVASLPVRSPLQGLAAALPPVSSKLSMLPPCPSSSPIARLWSGWSGRVG